ncbi:MAG: right-handed parallel beta-helix repeat-containing protein [Chloroflexi bacterium]|nr:right-handed parallel beta-helix repeat-containing protein [Chloroflexota bacterium]
MKTSRILRIRHLAMVALTLSLTLASVGSMAPAALGYDDGPGEMAGPGTPVAAAKLLPDDGDGVPNSVWPPAMPPQVTASEEDEVLSRASQAPWAARTRIAGSGTQTANGGPLWGNPAGDQDGRSRMEAASTDSVITVTTTADEFGSGAGCSLREAIQAANTDTAFGGCPAGSGADTITLPAGTYTLTIAGATEDANATGDLDILSDLTINGDDTDTTIIDAQGLDRVLHVHSGQTVSVNNVTMTEGQAPSPDDGGGIENSGGTVTLNNSTIISNTAAWCGGGIYNKGTVTLNNSTISSNHANGGGGGIHNYPGSTVTLNNSTISNNSADWRGGGIWVTLRGDVTITNSTISDNSTGGNGGGIENSDGTLTLNNSTVSNNSAERNGGGIYNEKGTVTLDHSTVISNSAEGSGGGIHNYTSCRLTLTSSSVSNNSAEGSGGGIYSYDFCSVGVSNSSVSNNSAGYRGGGIYNNEGGSLSVKNSTVSNNDAIDLGGGFFNKSSSAGVSNSTLSGNSASSGGGIYVMSGNFGVKSTIIAGNDASANDDCAFSVTSHGYNLVGDGTGCPHDGTGDQTVDPADVFDTVLSSLQDNGGPTFTQALLEGSPAIDAGFCLDLYDDPVLTDQRGMPRHGGCDTGAFETPRSPDELEVTTTADEFGENRSACSLREAVQAANTDMGFGGCFPGDGADTIILPAATYTLTIAGVNEDANATGDLDILSDLTINGDDRDTTIIDAQGLDRVLHVHSDQAVSVDNVTITGGQTPSGDNGGGIENSEGTVTVTNSTLSDNSADNAGGGINNDQGDVTVGNSTLSGNSAVYGGGIATSGTLTVTNSTVSDNSADNNGGGINNDQGDVTVGNSTLSGNSAVYGGGIATSSTLTIINSTISSNDAAQGGGGIHSGGGNTSIQFTTIALNTVSSGGANVQSDGGSVELFATIIANPLDGPNCDGDGLTSAASGYNRTSDSSCELHGADDQENVTIELGPLADNGGPTLTHRPAPSETVVDIMPRSVCESAFQNLGLDPKDQRGKDRPAWGIRQEGVTVVESEWKCDAGAVELGAEEHYVCGPPLLKGWDGGEPDFGEFGFRCAHTTAHDALQKAQTGDIIIISGVVTETVTVSKTVTIRGPATEESTPGTHMGIVQAALDEPDGDGAPGSVFTIIAGPSVTIEHLNIRHGDANQGGGINNAGDLTLEGVTIYASHAITGGAVYNSGTLMVTNSTIVSNTASSGAGIYSASTATVIHVTLADNDGSSIHNAGTAGSVVVSGTILSAPVSGSQCTGDVTSEGFNLVHGANCFSDQDLQTPLENNVTGDPVLGPLRDNGGPTLTRAISADSAAVEAGPLEADCAVETDQRGKGRPFDVPGGGGARCDIGAVEYGSDTLTVCEKCEADPDNGRFNDLQEALDRAMAGDTVAIEAGAYTGNFIAYKDMTLQHAGIDVAMLSQGQSVDVRAILQASERTIREQHHVLTETQASGLSGTVLTVQAYYPVTSTGSIAVTGDVTVTLTGLTMRHGLSRQGGGVYNVGHLHVIRSTISENAAVNELQDGITVTVEAQGGAIYNLGQLTLERSTISGNRSEFYGGAIYTVGSDSQDASVDVVASTIANNKAEKLPRQHVINITDAGFDPSAPTVDSGDEIQFQDRTAEKHWLEVPKGQGCTPEGLIEVPRMGAGLSEPLICTVSQGQVIVTVRDRDNPALSIQIEVNALSFKPQAHAIYATGRGDVTVARSIVVHSAGSGDNCEAQGLYASIGSGKYNLVSDSTCNLTDDTDLRPGQEGYGDVELGPLQDNNAIDHEDNLITGYTYSHALRPGSPAIDYIPPDPDVCGAASQHTINIASGNLDLTIEAGDIVQWTTNTVSRTIALNDGEANANLVAVPAGGSSRDVQLAEVGDYPYRVYKNDSRAEIAHGTIEVQSRTRETDQRGTTLPQRGTGGTYYCDVGAYEFSPWVVGQPLPRPPAAIGAQGPQWDVAEEQSYHAWSSATALDYALRPSPLGGVTMEPVEIVVNWQKDQDPMKAKMTQYGIVEWPDKPQIHASGARVNLIHDGVSDGFQPSGGQAFEGLNPKEDVTVLTAGVFTRTELTDLNNPGDSYSVLQFVKGAQANIMLKVQVVKTVGWNTPGVRDVREERAVCEIGREIRYRSFEDAVGTLPGHEDPQGLAGQILEGDAFDGIRTTADLAWAQNTVDNLIPPAHIQDTREGPIIPILNTAPTQLSGDLVTGDHDLRIAWYRPDGRNVAWPLKTVGYRCDWPADPPEIVIASELGSEVGGQPVLSSDRYSDLAIYHQPDPTLPGFNPNDEHALLASSNLGNSAPALYALRTDLWDPQNKEETSEPYALLKYRDPREDDQIKIQIYKVVLTRAAEEITDITPDPGTITLLASTAAGVARSETGHSEVSQSLISNLQSLTVRVADGNLPPGGDVTVPVEALGARDLRSATIKVSYDPTKLTPTACTTNRLDFVERLYGPQISTDGPAQPFRTVHMRASLDAGTDAQYEWDFGDGTTRIAGDEVSHVYGAVGMYTVIVTATNGLFDPVTADTQVEVAEGTVPGSLDDDDTTGCRIEADGELTIELKSRNKHGLSGNLLLSELTFEAVGDPPATDTTTDLDLTSISLFGPGYEELGFNITAGNPIYAPTPLRGLLDIQPCEQTQAADLAARPFWRDFKDMLWARAAGDMQVLYFYPLQPGFYLADDHAKALGLVQPDDPNAVLSPDERVGKCVPWMDKLTTGVDVDFRDYLDTTDLHATVYPVAYHADWPDLPPLLSVGETVYERAKSGISGVANQLAVSRIYDDLAPGSWNNDAEKIVIEGAEVQRSLAELIDPIGEVRVHLDMKINDNWSLPTEIQTKRLLFGGGQAVVGNKTNPDLALPFSLRSRILFDDSVGELIFRGYYDGTSPEYIKGDPLLLLNVMSKSDKTRLWSLCPGGGDSYPFDDTNCGKYKKAIEDLYHKTRNPRQVDLCRKPDGTLYPDGSRDDTQLPKDGQDLNDLIDEKEGEDPDFDYDEYNSACEGDSYRDLAPDTDFLISVQDADDNGVPEPYEGLGKGKALSAGNAAGTGYITVAYNNDASLGGLPVSLQVIKVGCTKNHLGEDSTYRGNLLVIKSDNLFDEKLTLRHTGDFGGQPGNFEFEWWIAEVDETGVSPTALPPNYPWKKWTRLEPGTDAIGPEITIEGANPTTLSDNWLIMRYKNYPCCGNNYRWSAFAGDPSAKPSEVRGQLAEGWIKRVVGALNPFDTRVDDFVSTPVNTAVDMIRQAGPRYEGPVAMSNDPDVLNSMGLIEAYQTVLDRGRDLSIDSSINHQGANAALLNVTSRIADLYMLLGNDAYMDALDPTIGLGTSSALASRAPIIFSFMNQFRSDSFGLIDEELGLLRGRDETLGGVAAAPTYNRLTWNFTNGDGEVAYVMNYNTKDMNQDGFVNEADAAIMYPQGHGDAWGHHLTAIKKYYELLRHPNYTWVPRAEPVSVAGAPVVVDYYDERRFAISAAAKARMGAEIVDLTYRKQYSDPDSQEYVDSHVDASDGRKRAWGVADWARRAGQGAYFDWVMANAIIPPEDDRYTDVRKIDRTTVLEIGEVSDQYRQIQSQLDDADGGLNPLGLAQGAVLFDLDPSLIAGGVTHFEQVYERALASLGNTLILFDYANEMKMAERASQDARRGFVTTIIEKDTALINSLIELFGYPYDADIGVNGTYPEGYDGPDIYNYDLWDRTELTDAEKRCGEDEINAGLCAAETKTYLVGFNSMPCIKFFPEPIESTQDGGDVCKSIGNTEPLTLTVEYRIGVGLDAGRGRFRPESWLPDSARKAPGEIQNALQALNQARLQYEMAIRVYENHVEKMVSTQTKIEERAEYLDKKRELKHDARWTIYGLDQAIRLGKAFVRVAKTVGATSKDFAAATKECPPESLGMSNDATSIARCTVLYVGAGLNLGSMIVSDIIEGIIDLEGYAKDAAKTALEEELFNLEADYDLEQYAKQMGGLLREERQFKLALYLAMDRVNGAQGNYDAALQKGFRKLQELIRLRKRWAGQISEQRYSDMAYRIFQNDALQKYRQQFDLAQTYTYLTAAAYDYETNLSRDDPAMGNQFLRNIVGARTLGEVRLLRPLPIEPIVGSGGLADPLGRMKDNFEVLKGQMGFNNPQFEANRFSLRSELLRLRDDSDTNWRQELMRYYTPNIYNHDDVARLAKQPYGEVGSQPGLVIPIGSTVTEGLNFFGQPLGPGDSAYDATQFVTKIAAVGVWFEGYDTDRLAQTPRVYLLPAGSDVVRPRNTSGTLRYWNIVEQMLPVPHPIGQADLENPDWIARNDGLDGQLFAIKPYTRFRAYPFTSDFSADEMNTDTRLIGRSVWNTEWLLVIPGTTLLADPQVGIERFIEDVDDVYIYFQTYAYAGN